MDGADHTLFNPIVNGDLYRHIPNFIDDDPALSHQGRGNYQPPIARPSNAQPTAARVGDFVQGQWPQGFPPGPPVANPHGHSPSMPQSLGPPVANRGRNSPPSSSQTVYIPARSFGANSGPNTVLTPGSVSIQKPNGVTTVVIMSKDKQ